MVLKICISFTTPSWPWAEMKSPTLKGLNMMMTTPPAKFCKVPLKAIPMAKPAEARRATSEEVLTPRIPIIMIINTKFSTTETRFERNLCKVASARLLNSPLASHFFASFITQRPTIRTMRAITILRANGTTYWCTICGSHSFTGVSRSISTVSVTSLTSESFCTVTSSTRVSFSSMVSFF